MWKGKSSIFLFLISYGFIFYLQETGDFIKVSNHLQEIKSTEDRILIRFVREWGGDSESDENKMFFEPKDIGFDRKGNIYVLESTRIRVFDPSAKYIRTIGNKGQGPGELLNASLLEIDSDDHLLIFDSDNRRIQILNGEGEAEGSFPLKTEQTGPMMVTQKNEIIMLDRAPDSETPALWRYYSYQGRFLKQKGKKQTSSSLAESLSRNEYRSVLDKNDQIISAAAYVPLMRIYSPSGNITREISYEPPFEVPQIKEYRLRQNSYVEREKVCEDISVDISGRIFLLALTRIMRIEERKVGMSFMAVGATAESVSTGRVKPNIDAKKSDLFQILVFDGAGKIRASHKLDFYVNKMKISGKRLFLIDTFVNMRILEYEILER